MKKSFFSVLLIIALLVPGVTACAEDNNTVPVATQWSLDATGVEGRKAIGSVLLIICPKTHGKGTGFVLKNGLVLTASHVIGKNSVHDIYGITAYKRKIFFQGIIGDLDRDIAILKPTEPIGGGLELESTSDLELGTGVYTWGYPLGYSGPNPLLSVGFLAGFRSMHVNGKLIKRLIVNGAFNPGNSGGPLFSTKSNRVIGVVLAKHLPITRWQLSALRALANAKSGIVFTATLPDGTQKQFVEAQIVANLLNDFRQLTQVMIGEAISYEEILAFLKEKSIDY